MATNKPSRQVFTGDFTQDRIQQNGKDAQQRLNRSIFAGGTVIDAEPGQPAGTGLKFTAGVARTLAHGLGKKATYVMELPLADIPSAASLGIRVTSQPNGVDSRTHVTVTAANTGTAALAIF